MGRPPIDRRPNALLAHWHNRTGMSNAALARAVTTKAAELGEQHVTADESSVRRWIKKGETPRAPLSQIICDVISEQLGEHLTLADLGFGPRGVQDAGHPDLPWEASSTIGALAHIIRSEHMLPTTRTTPEARDVHAGPQLLDPLQSWVSAPSSVADTSPADPAPGRIGMSDVENIRAVTTTFRDLDNRHGGALSRKAVIGQLDEAVGMLSGTYTAETGRALFSAVADLGSVAGWMTFDAGRHSSAQRIFVTALHAAAEGGDKAIGAHLLQCMARQMSHLGHYEDALDLVALAQYGARRRLTPAATSMLASLQARFHAILGNLDDSERATDQAQEAFTRIDSADEPQYMAFFDEAELCATLGVAHQIAARKSPTATRGHQAEKSLRLITQALTHRPEHRVRSMAFDHLGLARTHIAVGELDGAYEETRRSLELFGVISSRRVADRLVELHDEAEPFAGGRLGQDLRQLIAAAVQSE
ncbi:transcriptional regulator [Streptomyces sp. CFMR 7]|uniref:transcriptional regulator n=1 Tax=Streptomyces sp. CFMR 7 TaxID=1649184 RepID=UPI0021B54D19|nr:transcriptional regulator [Streptomyces sp. CFMR 7]